MADYFINVDHSARTTTGAMVHQSIVHIPLETPIKSEKYEDVIEVLEAVIKELKKKIEDRDLPF